MSDSFQPCSCTYFHEMLDDIFSSFQFPDSKKRSNFLCSIICCFGKRGGGSGSRRRQRRKDKDLGGLGGSGGGASTGGAGGGGGGSGSNSRSSAAGGDAADAAGVIASVGATAPKSGNVGIAASSTGGAKPLLQASSFSLYTRILVIAKFSLN